MSPLSVGWFDDSSFFVFKVKEVVAFFEVVSEVRLPFAEGVVTFFLFAK